tara:strand:- start:1572 stop:1835 length:264 start_codon:yes stop_codon:yes gene_type:complete
MLEEKVFEIEINNDIMESKIIKELVNSKISEINKLKSEVSELQNKCNCKTHEIKNVSDGVVSLRKVCTTCSKIVGYPSLDELREAGY